MSYQEIQKELKKLANQEKAKILQGFFKTGPGEYGEGDVFLGITVPVLRKLAGKYYGISLNQAVRLLRSPIHESRLLALLVMIRSYIRSDEIVQTNIYRLYLDNTRYINNWDLVDLSAPHIVGSYLLDRDRRPLYALAKSNILWDRRISIVSTFLFIRRNDFADTLGISKILLNDEHDLIHKSVGWMLREVGKRSASTLETFLKKHCAVMPRTMLRYAIERFPEARRQRYMKGTP